MERPNPDSRTPNPESLAPSPDFRPPTSDLPTVAVAAGGKIAESVLPGVLVALGWTAPPSLAVLAGAWLLRRVVRKVVDRKKAESKDKAESGKWKAETEERLSAFRSPLSTPQPRFPNHEPRTPTLNDDYARQLADVYALSGRSPWGDVTLGREYDEELRRAETSSDGNLSALARRIRQRVADKFHRIHGLAPMPADPIKE